MIGWTNIGTRSCGRRRISLIIISTRATVLLIRCTSSGYKSVCLCGLQANTRSLEPSHDLKLAHALKSDTRTPNAAQRNVRSVLKDLGSANESQPTLEILDSDLKRYTAKQTCLWVWVKGCHQNLMSEMLFSIPSTDLLAL